MLISALVGAIIVIVLLLIGCCCCYCLRRCECDCDCCMGLGQSKNNPADECKDPKPHYSLNIDEFYDQKGGKKDKEIEVHDEEEGQISTDALREAPKPKRFNTIHNSLDNTTTSNQRSREASFYVVNDSKASMKRQSTQQQSVKAKRSGGQTKQKQKVNPELSK